MISVLNDAATHGYFHQRSFCDKLIVQAVKSFNGLDLRV